MVTSSILAALVAASLGGAQSISFPPPPPAGCPDGYPSGIQVDASQSFQPMDGCGYSEAFQRGQWVYNALGDKNRGKVLDLLHDPAKGVGMSALRIGIGSSPTSDNDFMNSIEPVSPGSPGAKPVYQWDRNDSSQVWWAQQAKARGAVYFYGNAWGADGYMKTNGLEYNGTYLCGVRGTNCPTGDWRAHYARKLVKWVKLYAEEGVDITHLGWVNEPDQTVTYASMASDGYQAFDVFSVLAPIVRKQLPNIKLTWGDSAGWEQQRLKIKDLANAAGPGWEQYVDTVTSHGYDQPPTLPFDTTRPVWMTEWAPLSGPFSHPWVGTGDMGEGIWWANAISNAFVNSNVSLFTQWIGAETGNGASTLIMANTDDTFEVSPRLWAYAAYCRYTRPGAVRIYANATEPYLNQYLSISAFKNPDGYEDGGDLAVQIVNNGPKAVELPVEIAGVGKVKKVKAYLLDNTHMLERADGQVTVSKGKMTASIPSLSMIVMSLSTK